MGGGASPPGWDVSGKVSFSLERVVRVTVVRGGFDRGHGEVSRYKAGSALRAWVSEDSRGFQA